MTTPAKIVAGFQVATEGLERVARYLPSRLREMDEERDGLRGTSYDRDGGKTSSTPDPTGDAVITQTGRALDAVDQLVTQLVKVWHNLEDALKPPEDPRARKRLLLDLEDVNQPGCESCARIDEITRKRLTYDEHGKPQGIPTWTAVYKRHNGKALCRWCYRHTYTEGRLPSLELTILHRHFQQNATKHIKANAERMIDGDAA